MQEKFYISNSFKFSIGFCLLFGSYGPVKWLLNGHIDISLVYLLLIWIVFIISWVNPFVTITDTLLIINYVYYKKSISLNRIISAEILNSGSIKITYNQEDKIKKVTLIQMKDQQKLIDLIKS